MDIKDSGERTQFETGAVRDMHEGKGRMDLLPLSAIIELSKHCENGARKYGEHNVDKGIPQHSLCDSAMRHLVKYMRGDHDEDHLVAAAWNIMWALNQRVEHPELNDLIWNPTITTASVDLTKQGKSGIDYHPSELTISDCRSPYATPYEDERITLRG